MFEFDDTENEDNQLMELYQELILDHNKRPRNFSPLPSPPALVKEGFNPLCGDHLHLYLEWDQEKGVVKNINFQGEGCAISKASTSMMTESLKGKSADEIARLSEDFLKLLTKKLDPKKDAHKLGKLTVFSGIWKYPSRVKCAGLAWHTLKQAVDELKNSGTVGEAKVSTE